MRRVVVTLVVLATLGGVACSRGAPTAQRSSPALPTTPGIQSQPPGRSSGDYCRIARALQQAQRELNFRSRDKQLLADRATQYETQVERATGFVPEEIRSDWQTLSGALRTFVAALRGAKWDLERARKQNAAAIDGLRSNDVVAAARRVAEYDKRVCGIGAASPSAPGGS